MTALHEVPAAEPAQESHGISRRRLLYAGAGALGVAAVSVTGGFLLFGGSNEKTAAMPPAAGQGGQAGAENLDTHAIEPLSAAAVTNVYHIYNTFAGEPSLGRSVKNFLGTAAYKLIKRQPTDGVYPWLQITTDAGEHLTMSLQQVGPMRGAADPVRSWSEAQKHSSFNPGQWTELREGTMVSFSDTYPRGLTLAGMRGWTNIGTPAERRFEVGTQHVEHFKAMSAGDRQAAFATFTNALFDARAFG